MSDREIYISVDIETNGGAPLRNSMLSIGAAAFIEEGDCLGLFERNLELLPGSVEDPETMAFWRRFPGAYAATRENLSDPKGAMEDFVLWCQSFPGKPVFVAYPAGFDFSWVYTYLAHFNVGSPFAWAALDVRTLAMAAGNTGWYGSTKRDWKKSWKSKRRHTHKAIDDAVEQGESFIKILADLRETHKKAGIHDSNVRGKIREFEIEQNARENDWTRKK